MLIPARIKRFKIDAVAYIESAALYILGRSWKALRCGDLHERRTKTSAGAYYQILSLSINGILFLPRCG